VSALLAAVAFAWFGMVLAISFVEAPLKFRAPGVTVPIGLGIGRIVFRALNGLELVLAVVAVVAVLTGTPSTTVLASALVPVVVLAVQLAAVRPVLNRRSDRVLAAGEELPRSHAHLWYVALEVVKIAALLWLGIGASIA
jgi:hypothetical protein